MMAARTLAKRALHFLRRGRRRDAQALEGLERQNVFSH
jgi:hypothetical protein